MKANVQMLGFYTVTYTLQPKPTFSPESERSSTYIKLIRRVLSEARSITCWHADAAHTRAFFRLGRFLKNMAAGNERIILPASLMNPIRQKAFFSEGEEEGV